MSAQPDMFAVMFQTLDRAFPIDTRQSLEAPALTDAGQQESSPSADDCEACYVLGELCVDCHDGTELREGETSGQWCERVYGVPAQGEF